MVKPESAHLLCARALIAHRLGLDLSSREGAIEAAFDGRHRNADDSLAALAALPDESPEWAHLARTLTVGETYFFRDGAAFAALETHVLPSLIAERRRTGHRRLRLWSAGCASGEEPYSLAILLDRLLPDHQEWSLTVVGTDANPDALAAARRGVYRDWSLRATPGHLIDRYFHRLRDGSRELDASIRGLVSFARLNLAANVYPAGNTSEVDVLVCRNVLMYFTREARSGAMRRLRDALAPGGWLMIGPAEASSELLGRLACVTLPDTLFYRRLDASNGTAPAHRPEPRRTTLAARGRTARRTPTGVRPPREPVTLPHSARLLDDARALADGGQLDEARAACEQALRRDRLDFEAHLLLSSIRQEAGDLDEAARGLRRALYLAPDAPALHFALGALLVRSGRPRPGRRCLQVALRLLESRAQEEVVEWSGGFTVRYLAETARGWLATR